MINRLKIYSLFIILLGYGSAFGQAINYSSLTLEEAIELGLQQNKKLQTQRIQTSLAELKEKDLKNEKLPEVNFHSSFNVLSNLRQYEDGLLNPSTKYETPRLKYDFTLSAEMPIYYGGKLKFDEEKAALETKNTTLEISKSEREVKLEIITAYLQVLHLQQQQKLMSEKIKEDEAVVTQTKKLEKNGVVTFNEVLRTQLQQSNHQITYNELGKEMEILIHKVKTLLSIPEEQSLALDTHNLLDGSVGLDAIEDMIHDAYTKREDLQMIQNKIQQSEIDKKIVKANILPKISAGAEYGYNYPNFMFFPPQEHLYRFGSVGISLVMPLDNLYKNKVKVQEAEEKLKLSNLQLEHQKEAVRDEVFAAQKRLEDAVDKLELAQKAIDQAKENYRIVKLKYANKLSLITELIDADNALLEAESHMISLQINKQLKNYQLQYVLGNL